MQLAVYASRMDLVNEELVLAVLNHCAKRRGGGGALAGG